MSAPEDIFNDSLEFLGEEVIQDTEIIFYGPIRVTAAPKEGKANTLLADHLFSPSLYLAELIETGEMMAANCSVIELGAGCALPSLLLSTMEHPPTLVTITDYPDQIILGNLRRNIDRNSHLVSSPTQVHVKGYDWGTDASDLLDLSSDGYDLMILSDLLHFSSSHDALVISITSLLRKQPQARVYVAAGKYTKPDVCQSFLQKGNMAGLVFHEITSDTDDCEWRGRYEVSGLDNKALSVRKAACRCWIGEWA